MSTKRKIEDETEPTKKAKHVEEGKEIEKIAGDFFFVYLIFVFLSFSQKRKRRISTKKV